MSAGTFLGNQQSEINKMGCLQSRLNLSSQSAKVGHALQFVIRKLYPEVIFQFREQVERLQAVDTEHLEEVFVRREFLARHFEVRRGKREYLVERLFRCFHKELF